MDIMWVVIDTKTSNSYHAICQNTWIRIDKTWRDMIWSWYDMIWYDDMIYAHDMIWYNTIRYNMMNICLSWLIPLHFPSHLIVISHLVLLPDDCCVCTLDDIDGNSRLPRCDVIVMDEDRGWRINVSWYQQI